MKKAKTITVFTANGLTLKEFKDKYYMVIDEHKYEIYQEDNESSIVAKFEKGNEMMVLIEY